MLPAVVVASRSEASGDRPTMASVYECAPSDVDVAVTSVLEALSDAVQDKVQVGGSAFEIRRGYLNVDAAGADP